MPGVSDLDLVALVDGPVEAAQVAALKALHRQLDASAAQGLDLGCDYAVIRSSRTARRCTGAGPTARSTVGAPVRAEDAPAQPRLVTLRRWYTSGVHRPIGSVVGSIAGLLFVLINAGAVPGSLVWRIAGVVGFAAAVWFAVIRGSEVAQTPPSRAALRTYGLSVAAMIVALPVGAALITNVLQKPNATPVWVVFVVGAHFLPFARAFQLPVFMWLSLSLVFVSVVGAVPSLAYNSGTAAGWTGVVAGFVLLLFSAIGPRLSQGGLTRAVP